MSGFNFILPGDARYRNDHSIKRKTIKESSDHKSHELLVDKYKPTTETEICVPAAKVTEIKKAIKTSALYSDQYPTTRFIIVSGPTGCGKSSLIHLLSKTMGFDILEWENPYRQSYNPETYNGQKFESTMTKFEEFMHFAIRFEMLKDPQHTPETNEKKVILLDDIPDLTTDNVKHHFQHILQTALYSDAQFLVIMTINDTNDAKINNANDIIPKCFHTHPHVKFIKLNPVTIAKMKKILDKVMKEENLSISDDTLEDLLVLSNGDIRLALNNLQFQARIHDHHSVKRLKPTKRKSKSSQRESREVKRFDEHVGPLNLFHAIGKVLYAKRLADGSYESAPEHILHKLPVDHDLFISHLHQNCLDYFDDNDMESLARCLSYLSDADTIRLRHDRHEPMLAEYRCEVSIRGMMTKPPAASVGWRPCEALEDFEVRKKARETKREKDMEEWMASVQSRNTTADEVQRLLEEDPVEAFSSDEFDDEFGDGSDLQDFLDF
ncbi:Rad17 cell cycle checkpoint protein-domain-containing protein [Mycotypha africana]|uniref:Rad17 cell cycle checkpoint protein-domain-containing protein n=1 Tax=Mycotypha africana TaxID=64632 RepID=UPI002300CAAF|nr:Rad17 cell cycle checkpoint protein-domain-containing protein [Mycotypha africana]KAI8982112.1 Rad17 cell cycle checkpoint protein-domain-containing protein [Mycotypha africana]